MYELGVKSLFELFRTHYKYCKLLYNSWGLFCSLELILSELSLKSVLKVGNSPLSVTVV